MSTSPSTSKSCPKCGEPMGANRGVCPNTECDYQSTWFMIRLYFGCAGVLVAFVGLALMLWMAMQLPE